MKTARLTEAIGDLHERVKVEKSQKRSGSVDVTATAEVEAYVKLSLDDMRVLLQRRPLELEIPDSNREGHKITVTLLYAGKMAGA